jgi:hypothetical protein
VSALQVRKAYRKAALKYHPDKAVAACKFSIQLPISSDTQGSAPKGTTQDQGALHPVVVTLADGTQGIETRVREEANWLFSIIGQVGNIVSSASC